jgi:hypothetical protein
VIRARGLLSAGVAVFIFLTGCGPTRERAAFDPAFLEGMCKKLDGVWAGTREDTDRRILGTYVLTLKCAGRTLSASYEGVTRTEAGPRPFSQKAVNVLINTEGLTYQSFNASGHITYFEFTLDGDSLTGTSEGNSDIIWYNLNRRP